MIKIGLTGGIGSGKTTVAQIFESFGVPIYNSDERAKWLMNNNRHVKNCIVNKFGKEAYTRGKLNRVYIAKVVFQNSTELQRLNDCVHPAVAEDFTNWANVQVAPFVIKEAAILIESGASAICDKIIVVNADVETRIDRVIKRDQVTRDQVLSRMQHQFTDKQRMEHADFVIYNNGKEMLLKQVKNIIDDLKPHTT